MTDREIIAEFKSRANKLRGTRGYKHYEAGVRQAVRRPITKNGRLKGFFTSIGQVQPYQEPPMVIHRFPDRGLSRYFRETRTPTELAVARENTEQLKLLLNTSERMESAREALILSLATEPVFDEFQAQSISSALNSLSVNPTAENISRSFYLLPSSSQQKVLGHVRSGVSTEEFNKSFSEEFKKKSPEDQALIVAGMRRLISGLSPEAQQVVKTIQLGPHIPPLLKESTLRQLRRFEETGVLTPHIEGLTVTKDNPDIDRQLEDPSLTPLPKKKAKESQDRTREVVGEK